MYAAGSIDVDETVRWAEETLDGMSGGARNQRSAPSAPNSEYRFVKGDAEHCHVAMGFPSYGASHPDRSALTMLSAVLEILLKDGRKDRKVIEQCSPNQLGSESIVFSSLVGKPLTWSIMKGKTTGDYITDYVDSTETQKTQG